MIKNIILWIQSIVLTLINLISIILAFGLYKILNPSNQIIYQSIFAFLFCLVVWIIWNQIIKLISGQYWIPDKYSEWLIIYFLALIWTPVIFIPLHYFTQGYLTSISNILSIWLFQIPTNLCLILVSRKMGLNGINGND